MRAPRGGPGCERRSTRRSVGDGSGPRGTPRRTGRRTPSKCRRTRPPPRARPGRCALPQPPRPGPRRIGGVLRQALAEQSADVILVPALGLVLAQDHPLLAGRQVLPRLSGDLVRRGQVVLGVVGAHGVGPAASCLLGCARAGHLTHHRLQVGRLGCLAGGRATTRHVLTHGRGDQVAHAAGRGAENLLVLGPVGGPAQLGQQVQVVLGGLLLRGLVGSGLLGRGEPLVVLLLLGLERLLPSGRRGAWGVVLAVLVGQVVRLLPLLLLLGHRLLAAGRRAPGTEGLGLPLLDRHRELTLVHARQASLVGDLLPGFLGLAEGEVLALVLEHALLIGVLGGLAGLVDDVLVVLRVVALRRVAISHGLRSS